VADENGSLVREAVTLGRLEYCLLYDEDGNKRYEQGPKVVFPRPTEVFANRELKDKEKTRKFKAIELNENSGIYVKIIAEYEEAGVQHKVGDELFITGKEQMIYFPREEHAIVKYDNSEVHYGIAIPAGEARYVLDRNRGAIRLVKGPVNFLPDPRTEVIVRRTLDFKICGMLYPGNQAALEHNANLSGMDLSSYLSEAMIGVAVAGAAAAASPIRGADVLTSQVYLLPNGKPENGTASQVRS
jgi:major vault protein